MGFYLGQSHLRACGKPHPFVLALPLAPNR